MRPANSLQRDVRRCQLFPCGIFGKRVIRNAALGQCHSHRAGRPISVVDAQIAAITRSRGAKLVTRNAVDFERCGIDVIDPWQA